MEPASLDAPLSLRSEVSDVSSGNIAADRFGPNGVRMNALTPAPSAGEITPPWAPIVRLPALNHALIVMGWHVEMHEVYSPVCSFRGEGEDQGRIWIPVVKFGRAPGLDHEPLRDDLERRTGERAIEGLEWRTRLDADRDRRTSDRRMLRGIGVHREETFGWGRQDDRLGNDGSHGTLASSLESETPVSAGRSGAGIIF
jgi:hypothetical protein